jgi:hypothetical protein
VWKEYTNIDGVDEHQASTPGNLRELFLTHSFSMDGALSSLKNETLGEGSIAPYRWKFLNFLM